MLEKDKIISAKQQEIEELKKQLSSEPLKEKEDAFQTEKLVETVKNESRSDKQNYAEALREKEFLKIISKNSELEENLQKLIACVTQITEEKLGLENKYHAAMEQILAQNKRIDALELREGRQPIIQNQVPEKIKIAKPAERLTRGVFGMGSD